MICTKSEMFDLEADKLAKLEYDLDAGIITWASKPLEELFGYTLRGELEGKPVETLLPTPRRVIHKVHVSGYAKHPEARAMGVGMTLEGQRADGTVFPVAVLLCPGTSGSYSARKRVVIATVLDLTARVQSAQKGAA